MEISAEKLQKARRVLDARTDTQAIERALDLVIANAEIEQAMTEVQGSLPNFSVE